MTHWNYRILARSVNGEVQYGFHEVHYENDVPVGYTENTICPLGFDVAEDPIESINWQLDAMRLASDKPVLDYDNFPKEYVKYSRKRKLKVLNNI